MNPSSDRVKPENWPYYSALFLDGFKAGYKGNMINAMPALMESFGMSPAEATDAIYAWMANHTDTIKPADTAVGIMSLEGWGICGNCVKLGNGLEACEDPKAKGCHLFVPTEEFAEELVQRRARNKAKVIQDIKALSSETIASLSNFTRHEDIDKLRDAVVRRAIVMIDTKAIKPDERWQIVWNNFKIQIDVSQYLDDPTWEKELVEGTGCAVPPGLCSAP